jgi:hypothetical protein
MPLDLNGTTGIVLPTAAAPAFSAYLSANQTMSVNTWTKVTLNTEIFDTNSNFDSTTNYRFTPTIAGYYQISWCVFNSGSAFNGYSQLYKNGTGVAYGGTSQPSGGVTSQLSAGSFLVSMNGTTDYLELYSYAGVTLIGGGSTVTYMTGAFVRSL